MFLKMVARFKSRAFKARIHFLRRLQYHQFSSADHEDCLLYLSFRLSLREKSTLEYNFNQI
jgi:hypothetical protein